MFGLELSVRPALRLLQGRHGFPSRFLAIRVLHGDDSQYGSYTGATAHRTRLIALFSSFMVGSAR